MRCNRCFCRAEIKPPGRARRFLFARKALSKRRRPLRRLFPGSVMLQSLKAFLAEFTAADDKAATTEDDLRLKYVTILGHDANPPKDIEGGNKNAKNPKNKNNN